MSAIYGPIRPLIPFRVAPELYLQRPPIDLLCYTQAFRRELMSVVADLLLLTEDGFFRSYIEHRPLRQYKSRAKFDQASRIYPTGVSPYSELARITRNCHPKWAAIVNGLI
jgi:hypothetical protein